MNVYKVIGRNRETGQIVFDSSARRLSAILSYLPMAEAQSKAEAMTKRFPEDDYTVTLCPEASR